MVVRNILQISILVNKCSVFKHDFKSCDRSAPLLVGWEIATQWGTISQIRHNQFLLTRTFFFNSRISHLRLQGGGQNATLGEIWEGLVFQDIWETPFVSMVHINLFRSWKRCPRRSGSCSVLPSDATVTMCDVGCFCHWRVCCFRLVTLSKNHMSVLCCFCLHVFLLFFCNHFQCLPIWCIDFSVYVTM